MSTPFSLRVTELNHCSAIRLTSPSPVCPAGDSKVLTKDGPGTATLEMSHKESSNKVTI